MTTIEVESRFIVTNPEILKKYANSELEYVGSQCQVDMYFDKQDGSLFRKGVFIRLRNGDTIDFKFNMQDFLSGSRFGSHTECNEFSFSYPLEESQFYNFMVVIKILSLAEGVEKTFESFLESNGIKPSIVVEKIREEYKRENITVCIDQVKDLGTFLELEMLVSNESEIEQAREALDHFIPSNFCLERLTTGYIALFWRKKDFEIYKAGKYHTAEDKIDFLKEKK